MDSEKLAAWNEWVLTLSEKMQRVIKSFCGPADCYRLTYDGGLTHTGHYRLYSIDEPADGSAPTAKIIHGRDSGSPGMMVFGIALADLRICDCGKWERPTPEQIEEMDVKINVHAARLRGHTNLS